MKPKTRKLLSVTGAVLISMGATTAAATGNLRVAPEKPKPVQTADAGTPTPAPKDKPAEKK